MAIATQRQLEQNLAEQGIAVSYRWSLNEIEQPHLISDFTSSDSISSDSIYPDLITSDLIDKPNFASDY
jgi:hypothetical protein